MFSYTTLILDGPAYHPHRLEIECRLYMGVSAVRNSFMAQTVKNPLIMQETWVQSLGWEDSPGERNGNPLQYSCLEKSLAGNNPWGRKESDTTEQLTLSLPTVRM